MSGFKLYEISELLREAMAAAETVLEDGGIIPDDWAAFLDDVQMERDQKCLAVAAMVRELLSEAEAIKTERQRLQAREKAADNKAERLKAYLATAVHVGEKLKDERVAIGWRKSEATIIDMPECIPDEFCRIERKPMASEIKEAIKAGREINGAHIETRNNITIR